VEEIIFGKKSCIFVWKAVRIGEIFFYESVREID